MPAVCIALAALGLCAAIFAALRGRRPASPALIPLAATVAMCGATNAAAVALVWRLQGPIAHELRGVTIATSLAIGILIVLVATLRPVAAGRRPAASASTAEQRAPASADPGYRDLADALPQMVWIVDQAFNVRYVNNKWLAYTGLPFEPGQPSKMSSLVHPDDRPLLAAAHAAQRAAEPHERELRFCRCDGTYIWHLMRAVPLERSADTNWVVTATDIQALKLAETALSTIAADLAVRADHDPLTNLPNRTKLKQRLAGMIETAQEHAACVAVLYVDVDHFKTINDTLGHETGDRVLLEIAERIRSSVRGGDVASRFGGDEFVVACMADNVGDATTIAERIALAVRAPIDLSEQQLVVSTSIGISVFPGDGREAQTLIANADLAMYCAKQTGRNAWCRYDEQTDRRAAAKAAHESKR